MKKVLISTLVSVIVALSVLPAIVFGADYTLENGDRLPIPQTYTLQSVIYNFPGNIDYQLKDPEDLFLADSGELYIVDTGNNRILKANKNGDVLQVFTGGDDNSLSGPKGVFVDKKGTVFVADTGNMRIVEFNTDGQIIKIIKKPDSEMIDSNSTFNVSKICVSITGLIYVLHGQKVMMLDNNGVFKGYLGQSEIGFDFRETFYRLFATEQQKKILIQKRLAAIYSNIAMDSSGMLYATTNDKNGELKKINATGKNLLLPADAYFGERRDDFGDILNEDGDLIYSLFVDVAISHMGIISAIDSQNGRIYQFDQTGNTLAVFGGIGERKGQFAAPSALVVDENNVMYVLDRQNANLQIFKPTSFILDVYSAVSLYENGEYDSSYIFWRKILATASNYRLAHIGCGKVLLKQGKYAEAQNEFYIANDKVGYSQAFSKLRHQIFRSYFFILLIGIILLLVIIRLAFWLIRRSNNQIDQTTGYKNLFRQSLQVMSRPTDTFLFIKSRRSDILVLPGVVLFIAAGLVRLIYLLILHYPLSSNNLIYTNFSLEVIKLLLPVLTWVLASLAVTSISGGESKWKEILLCTGYSMMPYILLTVPLGLLSRVLCLEEAGLFSILQGFIILWVLWLLFLSLLRLNDYTVAQTIRIAIISVLLMLLIWATGVLLFALLGQVYNFLSGIYTELIMTL